MQFLHRIVVVFLLGSLLLGTGQLCHAQAPAFAGTWKATDAVDDYERAAVIVIRRKGDAYELIDPSIKPRQILRGRARGTRLTFVQRAGPRTTTYTFLMQRGGNALTGDTYDGQTHLGYHFVRVSHRAKQARIRRRHAGAEPCLFLSACPEDNLRVVWGNA